MGDPDEGVPKIIDGISVLRQEPFSRLAESLGCGAIYDPDFMSFQDLDIKMTSLCIFPNYD